MTGMMLKKEKCALLLPSVMYLGHVISKEGLHTEETKVPAIEDAPEPKNLGELKSFLGMVPNSCPTLLQYWPLYILLRKSCHWRWRSKQKKVFNRVKEHLKSGRVLYGVSHTASPRYIARPV